MLNPKGTKGTKKCVQKIVSLPSKNNFLFHFLLGALGAFVVQKEGL